MSLQAPHDQDIVIVGATGDLARRKLLPALYNLCCNELLPGSGRIIGFARTCLTYEEFRDAAEAAVREHSRTPFDAARWQSFEERLTYVCQDDGYAALRERASGRSRLIYLATPPAAFARIVEELEKHDLVKDARLLIEKPFGSDFASAKELDRTLHRAFHESQIFRIDHFLGKETVQNILIFRFGNSVFERIWNRDAIDHIQITVAESIGIEGRGAFYEGVGALRDIIQNHVFQVLSLLTMEPPVTFEARAIREEKTKLLDAVQPIDPARVVRGQYGPGTIDGEDVPGYCDEPGVSGTSTTETFVALELCIDNWRWAGVPVFLRAGKRLPRRATEIKIGFRDVPIRFFEELGVGSLPPNHLTISIQPDEAILFAFLAKVPGPDVTVKPVHMGFSYEDSFMVQPAEAYERLLHDAMEGDATLFARDDSVLRAWQILQPVLDAMPAICSYAAGTWGPPEANALIAPRTWHLR
jgi:glucose-6-phosphate 1-dehydrogenase